MVKCLNENNGAIGYLESGHGWSEGLSEISLQNRDGRYVTSKHAFENGGIAGAANDANTPTDMRADWGNVEFIDKGGMNTFPIVLMSYVYVRTDIASHVSNEDNRGLLKLFLESLYNDEYIGKCKALAFTPPPEKVKEIATGNKGIKAIKWEFSTDNGENPWQFEIDTQKKIGANRYTISSKRKSYQGIELEDILTAEERAIKDIQELYKLAEMELGFKPFTAREEKRINDATILGALSLALWSVVIVGLIVAKFINII